MIIIAFIYACLLFFEWRYLKRKNRTARTYRIVFAFVIFTFLSMEALYYFRDQFTLADVIEMVFDPMEKFIVWGIEKNE
ncbi:hypothetical protein [uncultured Brevibacillus sp.]|uniref:hypothetical protein n=1 Tax=uncultured Brevibacillus sp. TaxID=169970 RepID=UPI0025915167|nr:hypothetical protein [uncultured Brevibacillus sp.]